MSNYVKSDRQGEEAARERIETKSSVLKLPVGDSYLRPLPPHKNMVDPNSGRATFFWPVPLHFNVGPNQKVVPCPRRMFGQRCPICEAGFALRNSGNEQAGNDLLPNYQMYMNVLVFDDGGEPVRNKAGDIEVKVWGPTRNVLDDVLEKVQEREAELKQLIDIADPEEGYLIKINRKGTTKTDTKYKVRSISTNPVPVMDYVEYWDPGLIDLTALNPVVSQEVMAGYLTGAEDADPLARPTAKAISAAFPDDDDTVDGEYTEVPVEAAAEDDEDAPTESPSDRLKAMVAGGKK
jgi:hypothetical protein